jgi:hypothetical protein
LSARADVAASYQKHCQKCHGADGKGDTKMGKKTGCKDMSTAEYWAKFDDARALKSVKEGMKEGDKVLMKPAEGLTDDESHNSALRR